MFLADTNIFLEVLLAGNKAEACKAFLARNSVKIHISDFSLHSIGVILFRHRQDSAPRGVNGAKRISL